MSIDNNDGTIKYREKKSWHFIPEKSVGDLNDSVVHLNIPLLVSSFYRLYELEVAFSKSPFIV